MSKEKQIDKQAVEEMAVEFAKINCNPKGCYSCNLCDEYGSLELNCEDYLFYRKMAETFYNAGYRKQSEGEWIGNGYLKHCSKCGNVVNFNNVSRWLYNFCPNCGAKMKGGAE